MNFLEQLENLRKKILKKTIITYLIIIIFLITIAIFDDSSEGILYIISGVVGLTPIIIILGKIISNIITNKEIKEYKKIYKKNITLEAFESFFTDINYIPEEGLNESIISDTKMMNTGDRYDSNDYISAKYKEIKFEGADVHIEKKYEDKDGHTRYSTLFKGQWFIFDFNKEFKANIQICENSFNGSRIGGFFSDEVYKKVKMEDVDFNKIFEIYAENELDAFYVLTPSTMEKIKKLNNELHGNLLFCLIDNKMHIGLHNRRDLFEPNVYKKINIEEEKQKMLNDIKIITEFVNILDLDNDLFKRRI